MTRDLGTAARFRWGLSAPGGVEGEEILRKRGLMEKKYWNRSRGRPGEDCLRSRRKKRSRRYTRRLKKNCVISTAWLTRRTKILDRDITRCMWPRSRTRWWCRRGMDTTRHSKL